MTGELWTPPIKHNAADFDFRLAQSILEWVTIQSCATIYAAGIECGITMALRHPEWAQAAIQEIDKSRQRRQEDVPPMSIMADGVVDATPIEIVTDEPINGV